MTQAFIVAAVADIASLAGLLMWMHQRKAGTFAASAGLPAAAAVVAAIPLYFLSFMIGGQYGLAGGGGLADWLRLSEEGVRQTVGMAGLAVGMWLFFALSELVIIECVGAFVLADRD